MGRTEETGTVGKVEDCGGSGRVDKSVTTGIETEADYCYQKGYARSTLSSLT